MTDDRFAKIEKRLTEQLARSDADSAVLQIVICRLASDRRDWRDYLRDAEDNGRGVFPEHERLSLRRV